jgi:hypothetical protein
VLGLPALDPVADEDAGAWSDAAASEA